MNLWNSCKSLIFGIAGLAFGGFYGQYIFTEHRDFKLLKQSGVDLGGSVDGASSRTKSGVTRRYLDIVYYVGGVRHKHSVEVNEAVYDKHVVGGTYFPTSVRIKYLPQNAAVFQIVDPDMTPDETLVSLWAWLLAALMLIGGVVLIYAGVTGFLKR